MWSSWYTEFTDSDYSRPLEFEVALSRDGMWWYGENALKTGEPTGARWGAYLEFLQMVQAMTTVNAGKMYSENSSDVTICYPYVRIYRASANQQE